MGMSSKAAGDTAVLRWPAGARHGRPAVQAFALPPAAVPRFLGVMAAMAADPDAPCAGALVALHRYVRCELLLAPLAQARRQQLLHTCIGAWGMRTSLEQCWTACEALPRDLPSLWREVMLQMPAQSVVCHGICPIPCGRAASNRTDGGMPSDSPSIVW